MARKKELFLVGEKVRYIKALDSGATVGTVTDSIYNETTGEYEYKVISNGKGFEFKESELDSLWVYL